MTYYTRFISEHLDRFFAYKGKQVDREEPIIAWRVFISDQQCASWKEIGDAIQISHRDTEAIDD